MKTTEVKIAKEKYPFMTLDEMKEKYKDAWVLMVNPQYDGLKLLGGFFVYKNKSQDRLVQKILELNQNKAIHKTWEGTDKIITSLKMIYTGEVKLPKNLTFCL